MLKGVITCKCGQLFGFETVSETIECPKCAAKFEAKDYGVEEIVEEVVQEEQT